MVETAVRNRVTDIHVTVQRGGYELAFRIDGELYYQGGFAEDFGKKLLGHVKSVAGMDVVEHRLPTEGRLKTKISDRTVEMRISSIPTLHGQDMVVRLFDRNLNLMEIDELGLLPRQLAYVQDMVIRPHGLILVSGPTGSGKTTTLYAMLRKIASDDRKTLTIENPIEYDLNRVNQTQINPRVGLTYASMLTAILRQDPDVIMIGEIRDADTARTAVRAANTGHLVLATTHASRASRAIETMLFLGVHPYFLATSLRCVMAQVLVKQVCESCRTPLPETAEMIVDDDVRALMDEHDDEPRLYQGTGCDNCRGTGYHGRLGLFEVFIPGHETRQKILDRASADEIDRQAEQGGMVTLEASAKYAAITGMTTMEEIVAAVPTL
jgi:type II secretory ATPase GspE/PulE/Tfp pilus assembly ATPase PilB-like protein